MKRLFLLFAILLSFTFFVSAYAHPGSLDEYGGHYDYSTGEYHYHHGYPAHSHVGGRCVYSFRDNTDGRYTYTIESSTNAPQYTTAPRPVTEQVHLNFFQRHPVVTWFGALAILIAVWIAVASKNSKDRERAKQLQLEKERKEAQTFYASHDLRTLCKMPDIYFVDDKRVPYEYNKSTGTLYGSSLDVYINYGSRNVYHRKGCQHARYLTPLNALSDETVWRLRLRTPCSICKPEQLPDITWYHEYLYHLRECERYGIAPKQNPIWFVPPPSKPVESVVSVVSVPPPAPEETQIQPTPTVPATSPHTSSPTKSPTVVVHKHTPAESPLHKSLVPPSCPSTTPTIPLSPIDTEPSDNDIPNISVMYRTKYPKTWSYIQYNTPDPENYICYYHHIWGRLQEHHGDGIIYGTLSEDDQKFVDYPSVKETVFLSSEKSDSYHSIPYCYSLLKSKPIEADAIHGIVRKRCTKCVPPK